MRREIKSGGRNGTVLIYTIIAMTVLCGFVSFAVDLGRVQLAKSELRTVADGAARAAAGGMGVSQSEAISRARAIARANKIDGAAFDIDTAQDIKFGKWNAATRTFAPSAFNQANAVHMITRKAQSRNTAINLMFASVLGRKFCDASGECVVEFKAGVDVDQNVGGTANPFLAGMPSGSVASLNNPHNSPDYAGTRSNPRQSPVAITMPIQGGMELTFDSINGDVRHDPNLPFFSPDGELTAIGRNTNGSENGISDLTAPINALVAVFLDDNAPNLTSAPAMLDFSTAASRDFKTLKPKLKQIFFIGDGKTSEGRDQRFVAPAGATRMYLATWDFFEWNNNAGSRNIKISNPDSIVTVK